MPIPALTPQEARELALRAGTTPAYLYQVLTGRRAANPALARRINAADPRILLSDLRPGDWHEIWPELVPVAAQPAEI
jgi:DNA-binding transcriptional regulator YdaS (Cro superfamily)